ncbi:MAG: endonuclease/exonuclease/phosphatase family protein, partial [Dehalococcoidia bacterium]|nr:endonuclease/exonuclease/phosphatase family protein [Dehalococcoidia bacterium]
DITGACGLGMLLFLVLNFVYYVNYEFDLPGGAAIIAPVAVIILLLTVSGTMLISSRYRARIHTLRPGLVQDWAPIVLSILLLVLPLAYLAAWDEPQPESASEGFPIRVMSYNLHQGFDVDGYLAIEELADTIEDQDPDIIALQEVSRGWVIDGSFDTLVWLSRRLDMTYVWGPTADSVWGSAILSRYPILDARNEPMSNNSQLQLKRGLIVSRIDIGDGGPLTVIATHLHHLPDEGHLRDPQVRAVLKALNNDVRSVLIGDFNALPDAPEMLLLEDAGLKDAFLYSSKDPAGGRRSTSEQGISPRGVGHGYTWPSDNPSKRIDYIWVSSDLNTSDFSMTDNLASDHFGVAVTLAQ